MTSSGVCALTPFIRKLEAAAGLSGEEREALEALPVTIREVDAHRDIVREGDRSEETVVLLEGWACRYKLARQGKRQILAFFMPGDAPDLQSLFLRVMDHSLAAQTDVRLAAIRHEHLRALTRRLPRLADRLWRETLVDAAIFREWMVGLGRRSAFERMAHLCCELYLRQQQAGLADAEACTFPITQSDLADALGLTDVHVNRMYRELHGQGLLTLGRGRLTIHDWQALAAAAEFEAAYLHFDGLPEP